MATVNQPELNQPAARLQARRGRRFGRLGPNLVLIAAGVFFLVPLVTMARFAFQNIPTFNLRWSNIWEKWTLSGLSGVFKEKDFGPTLSLSLKLTVLTVFLTLALLLPTALYVHVRLPRARGLVEFMSLLPYMVPPIALVAGVIGFIRPNARWFVASNYSLVPFYVVLALPFSYRAIDAGVRAIDVRTLIDASRSLGGGWVTTFRRALLPNLSSAVISASFLTATVVLGEFTIAQVLLKRTFPQFSGELYSKQPKAGTVLSLLTLIGTTALLGMFTLLTRRRARRRGVTTSLFDPTTAAGTETA